MEVAGEKENLFKILKQIVGIPSPTKKEKDLVKFIEKTYCHPADGSNWVAETDKFHNMYIRRRSDNGEKKLPLLMAHLDTVLSLCPKENYQKLGTSDFLQLVNGQVKKSEKDKIHAGFDDKAGVAAILMIMSKSDMQFRVLFVTQEEAGKEYTKYDRRGGRGIDFALETGFPHVCKHTSWIIYLDRENKSDIIVKYGNDDKPNRPRIRLCSKIFEKWIIECSTAVDHPMFVIKSDNIADPYNIRRKFENLDVVNLSCGFYHEHKNSDSLNIDETLGVMKVVEECLRVGFP